MATQPIPIPLDSELVGELFDRLGPKADIAGMIEYVVEDFLERTKHDDDLWRTQWVEQRNELEEDEFVEKFGFPDQGYQWGPVLLRNGTKLKMEYKGQTSIAFVRSGRIEQDGEAYSPSQWASHVAEGTARNAWRDIWVQEPFASEYHWIKAEDLRRSARHGTAERGSR